MQKIRNVYDVSRLRRLFLYNEKTGVLMRKTGCHADKPCGTLVSTGHMTVWVDGRGVGVHRIAWALYHGTYPENEVDHINGDGSDNRICNLRLATSSQNNCNRRIGSRNKSGVKGVFQVRQNRNSDKTVWRVAIGYGRGKYHIKQFECFGQAVRHAHETRNKLHGEFARVA